jgi:hypothetical protein
LGRNDILYTHLGCFGARGRAGGSAKSFENTFQESGLPNWASGASGLPQAQFCCWARWARFFMVKIRIMVDTVFLHIIYRFINLWAGEKGWMALGVFG